MLLFAFPEVAVASATLSAKCSRVVIDFIVGESYIGGRRSNNLCHLNVDGSDFWLLINFLYVHSLFFVVEIFVDYIYHIGNVDGAVAIGIGKLAACRCVTQVDVECSHGIGYVDDAVLVGITL